MRWTKEELELLEVYKDTHIKNLEKLFPYRNKRSIYKKLEEFNRTKVYGRIDERVKSDLVEEFLKTQNCKEASLNIGIPPRQGLYILKTKGIPTKGRSFSSKCRRNVKFYTERFPYEDENILAYILGFTASDGSLNYYYKTIGWDLQFLDYDFLLRFASLLVEEEPILKVHKRKFKSVSFSTNLPKLYDFCVEFGIKPRKSNTINIPKLEKMSFNFQRYFIRGLIDGDGSIHLGEKLYDCRVNIATTSLSLAQIIVNLYGFRLSQKIPINPKHSICYRLNLKGLDSKVFCKYLPKDKFTLSRKTEKINGICQKNLLRKKEPEIIMENTLSYLKNGMKK